MVQFLPAVPFLKQDLYLSRCHARLGALHASGERRVVVLHRINACTNAQANVTIACIHGGVGNNAAQSIDKHKSTGQID